MILTFTFKAACLDSKQRVQTLIHKKMINQTDDAVPKQTLAIRLKTQLMQCWFLNVLISYTSKIKTNWSIK